MIQQCWYFSHFSDTLLIESSIHRIDICDILSSAEASEFYCFPQTPIDTISTIEMKTLREMQDSLHARLKSEKKAISNALMYKMCR